MPSPLLLDTVDLRPVLPFQAWKQDTHSQCGEDGILEHLLALARIDAGYFVEFGAWDGRHLSNCATLADRGFAGCFIEGDEARYMELRSGYSGREDIACVHGLVTPDGPNRLDDILERVGAPRDPAVLSIDIDGLDYHVWATLEQHRPTICVVEFNPTVPAHVVFVQAADAEVHQGCSLAALHQLALHKGYALVAATELNGIFMDEEVRAAHQIPAYTPDEVKSRTYETAMFHGYDGEVWLAGHRSLLWHGVEFKPERMQVLPEPLRRFPVGLPDDYHEQMVAFRKRQ